MIDTIVQVPLHRLNESNVTRHYWDMKSSSLLNPEIIDLFNCFVKTKKRFIKGGFGYTLQCFNDAPSLKEAEVMFAIIAKICVAMDRTVYFLSEFELLDIYAATFSKDLEAQATLQNLMEVDVVFLHSVTGADHKKFSAEVMTKLFKKRRDNRKSTFVATSLSDSDFRNLYTARAWDMLVELSPAVSVVEDL